MIDRLRRTVRRSCEAALYVVAALLIAQLIGVVHAGDIAAHADGSSCQICQAIGHASPLPTPIGVPAPPQAFAIAKRAVDPVATPHRESYSAHSPRAPPRPF